MAHGFLTPSPVTGESKIWKEIKKQFDKLRDKESKKLDDIDKKVSQIQNLLTGADQKALPPAAATKMLSGNKTKLLGAGGGLVEKNPTNIDVKTGKKLPPGGPRLPGKAKGGTFTNMGSPSPSGGLNGGNFFSKAVISGVDANTGEYLSKEARVAAFKAGRVQSVRQANPAGGITPDSGADIVAAMNRNTAAIVELVDVTKDQTKNDSNIAQEQIQAQDTMLSRQAARAEEKSLEQGSDLSGFLKAETFKKKNDGQGGSGGGGGGLLDLLGTGADLLSLRRRGGRRVRSRPRSRIKVPTTKKPNGVIRPRVNKPPGKGFKFPNLFGGKKPGVSKPGFKMPNMRGLGKFSKSNALLNTLFAGMEFAGRKSDGQTNVQAGVGTAASTTGGLAGAALGAKGGAAAGAAIGALFGGVGAVPGAAIGGVLGGLLGGFGGASLFGWGADKVTGADKVVPNRMGGIISKPILSLMGEGNKKEGVFPLEGKEGEKVFSNFGKGLVEAQLKGKKKIAEVQAFAMKKYYEHEGGFKMFGKALEIIFGPLLAGLKGIGGLLKNAGGGLLNIFGNLFGGAANAGEVNTGGLASFIGGLESGNDYTKMVGGAQDASVLNKTIDQLFDEKGGQFAMGRYQIQMRTAKDALRGAGIDSSTFKFDKAGQDKIFELLLKRRGLDDFMSGAISKEEFAKNLSQEWAALPKDASGAGWYDGDGTNKSLTSFSSVMGQLDSLKRSGNPMGSPASGNQLSQAAESLRGASTSDGPDGGNKSCVYAVNKVFRKAGVQPPWGSAQDTLSVINGLKGAGWQNVGFNNAQPGDVWVYDNGVNKGHAGIMTADGKVLSNSSTRAAFVWSADQSQLMNEFPEAGLTPAGGTFFRPPADSLAARSGGGGSGGQLTADQKASMLRNAGLSGMADSLSAVPASNNTGNPFMASSAQIAMTNMGLGGGAPTVINNYYGGGGNQQQGVNPNGVSAGISMDGTGTSIFQDLKIRTLN